MENTTEIKDTKKIQPKLILTIVGNVLFYAVIILLFLFSLMNINAGNGERDFPNLFGRGMLTVSTNSMERNAEPGYHQEEWKNYEIQEINIGDLVKVKVFKEKDFSKLELGQVITFVDESLQGKDTLLNTHRIVYIGDDYVICQGDYVVTTATTNKYAFNLKADDLLGENATVIDSYCQVVSKSNIKGVVTGVTRGAGKVLSNIRQNWLFYFVIPVALVLVVEIFFVFKNILDLRNEKNKASLATDKEAMAAQIEADKAAMMAEIEAEKERMRQELLAELKAQQAAMNQQPAAEEKPSEEPSEEPKAEETTPQEETEEKAE